jgi:hypothetical protein
MLAIPMLLVGCGDDDDDAGILSIGITDAKPYLPEGVEQVLITFDEVRVHRSGGGWMSLPMAQNPYTIDLLQFIEGTSTQLVPPVELESGKYTQVRLGIIAGSMVKNEEEEEPPNIPLEIPSEDLKTDKNFEFDVASGTAVDLMVDFDLSQSIKPKQDGYQLKPVLHLNETSKAATIVGIIDWEGFADSTATVTVESQGQEYTKLVVEKEDGGNTEFRIFWLVPNHSYTVELEVNGVSVLPEPVTTGDLGPGEVVTLNFGSPA